MRCVISLLNEPVAYFHTSKCSSRFKCIGSAFRCRLPYYDRLMIHTEVIDMHVWPPPPKRPLSAYWITTYTHSLRGTRMCVSRLAEAFVTTWQIIVITHAKTYPISSLPFADLLPSSDRFVDGDVTMFSRLLFDVARDQVIVGAR